MVKGRVRVLCGFVAAVAMMFASVYHNTEVVRAEGEEAETESTTEFGDELESNATQGDDSRVGADGSTVKTIVDALGGWNIDMSGYRVYIVDENGSVSREIRNAVYETFSVNRYKY